MNTDLSVLDRFAIAALPATAISDTLEGMEEGRKPDRGLWARDAFEIAELMLAESNKRKQQP